jgi:rare lipoprotein A
MNAIASHKNTRLRRYAPTVCAVLVVLAGSSISPAGQAEQPAKSTTQPQHHWYQTGRASWYGQLFQGRQTASGENFDMNAMTCAHPTLPLGSLIRVTNLRNHRSVIVRVNDRGPVAPNRIVDLSYAAARFLGFGSRGTAPVRLDLLPADAQLAQMTFPQNGTN